MPRSEENVIDDRRRERWHEKLRRLSPRPLAMSERMAIALAAVLGGLALVGAASVLAALLWGGWETVRREPLALGGIFFNGLPISALGAYWSILRHRDEPSPDLARCFGRALAGAGIGIAMAAGTTAVFVGLVLLAFA